MKKVTVLSLLLSLALVSCTNKYGNTLGNYLQINDNVKSDLKFKLLKHSHIRYLMPSDSLQYYQELNDEYIKKINENTEIINFQEKQIIELNEYLKKARKLYAYEEAPSIQSAKYEIEGAQKRIEYHKEYIGKLKQNHNICKEQYNYYSAMNPDKKLMEIVECKYKILNLQKNIMEEITQKYAFTLDKKECEEYDED